MRTLVLYAPGLRCAGCAGALRKRLEALPGVVRAGIDPLSKRALIHYDEGRCDEAALYAACQAAGFPAQPHPPAEKKGVADSWLLFPALAGAALLLAQDWRLLPAASGPVQLLLALPALIWGRGIFLGACRAVKHLRPDMDLLVGLSAGTALLYSLYLLLFPCPEPHYHFCAAAMVLAVVGLGRRLEERAKKGATRALKELADLIPETAHLLTPEGLRDLPSELLRPGDRILVRPGERLPADGTVAEGQSAVDEALLTGESLPVDKLPGQKVTGGSLNLLGALTVILERTGDSTALAGYVRLVGEAGTTRPRIARLADTLSGYFALGVLAAALLTLAVWWLLADFATALPFALAVLVVACPCALGLATPAALSAGLGRAARKGLFVREARALETLARTDVLFLDKTGTLTAGCPALPEDRLPEDSLLALAAALESRSEHPLAAPVVAAAAARRLAPPEIADFEAVPGRGLKARLAATGEPLLLGSRDFLLESGVPLPPEAGARLLLARNGEFLGSIELEDPPRPEASRVLEDLRRQGLRCVLLTGDSPAAAAAFERRVPLDGCQAGLRPEDKLAAVRRAQEEGLVAAMVGDGLNDAPALARADVAISHCEGAGAARESAGLLLGSRNLELLPEAFALSRKTLAVIRQNLVWALLFNALMLPLAAGCLRPLGLPALPPGIAALCMSASSLLVVSNALRLLRA